ncbi:hypothetical protein QQ020_16085 [Fulvivirgaceae bacterium BMA12]|uniref:Multidrug transporter n=2 Tax=Agaribacillus aureus TaxID=3051825 RepID=A0ABT8L762_9BACT|nr:hypothetical protein [Fulvivirgaceae bacterium BMA12]
MITIRSKSVLKTILGMVCFFVFLNVSVYLLVRFNVIPERYLLMVNLDGEQNLPTFYATVLLLTASIILLLIALRGRQKYNWYLLSGIFCFLSLDENIEIHEQLTALTKSALATETQGIFYFAWIIPYGIITILLMIFLFKFVWNLPNRTRRLFIISGFIFLSGALGLEMIAGSYWEESGWSSMIYKILAFSEETLEMTGVSLFIFALLDYIEENFGGLTISMSR